MRCTGPISRLRGLEGFHKGFSRGGFMTVLNILQDFTVLAHLSTYLGVYPLPSPRHDGPGQRGWQQYGLLSSGRDLQTL